MPLVSLMIPIMLVIVLIISGLVELINPRLRWEKLEAWKAQEEPSQTFFLLRRLKGLVTIGVACGIGYYLYSISSGF